MIIDASCVTIKHRMWIIAEGGGAVEEEGVAEVVACNLLASSDLKRNSPLLLSDDEGLGDGVDAVVSATEAGPSAIFTS